MGLSYCLSVYRGWSTCRLFLSNALYCKAVLFVVEVEVVVTLVITGVSTTFVMSTLLTNYCIGCYCACRLYGDDNIEKLKKGFCTRGIKELLLLLMALGAMPLFPFVSLLLGFVPNIVFPLTRFSSTAVFCSTWLRSPSDEFTTPPIELFVMLLFVYAALILLILLLSPLS